MRVRGLICLVMLAAPAVAGARTTTAIIEPCLRIVESHYLFDDQLSAGRLLSAALKAAEAAIPEVDATEVTPSAHLLVAGECTLRLEVEDDAKLLELAPALDAAAALIEQCVPELPEDLPRPASLLLNGLLAELDPYSTVFDSRGRTEHAIQFRGKLAGIGARIGVRTDALSLISVYAGSPAARAGLKNRDKVLRIDGVSTTNMLVTDAVERIRGEVGAKVVLTIGRDGSTDPFDVTVTRDLVTIPSVEARLLPSGNIYANISHFSQTTPADFQQHVDELLGSHRNRGVIVDLRANSGGSMLGSSSIADEFLDDGLLISTAGRHGETVSGLTEEVLANPDSPFRDAPVVILTSPRTASGSELMAASLRNHGRAIFVGQRSFGKGTVQKTYSLGAEEALKLTVGNFLPKGLAIPAGGLIPDVEIRSYYLSERGQRIPTPRDASSELPYWLRNPSWVTVEPLRSPIVLSFVRDLTEPPPLGEEEEEPEPTADDPLEDPAVRVADEILARHGSIDAAKMLTDSRVMLAVRAREADASVAKRLAESGVDWSAPVPAELLAAPDPNGLKEALSIEIAPAIEPLEPGSEGDLQLKIRNVGDVPLYRLRASVDADIGFLVGLGTLIGKLEPGVQLERTLKLKLPADLELARLPLHVIVSDDNGVAARFGPFHLYVADGKRPHLAHRVEIVPGTDSEVVTLRVEVANRGDAPSGEVRIRAEHPEPDAAELVAGSATLKGLAPGETATADLEVKLLNGEAELPALKLDVMEAEHRLLVSSKVDLVHGTNGWMDPPTVRFTHALVPDGDGSYAVVAEIDEDDGIARAWASVDGDKVSYADIASLRPTKHRLTLPWDPRAEARRYEVIVRDVDGLTTRLVTEL